MATYSALDFAGTTIYARKRVPVLRYPQDDSPVMRYIEAGQRIGVIYTAMKRRPGSKFWYWQFIDRNAPPGTYDRFHVPHDPSILNLPRLKEDYEDGLEEARRRNLEWWERVAEDGGQIIKQTATTAGSSIMTGALVLGGLYIAGRLLISGK